MLKHTAARHQATPRNLQANQREKKEQKNKPKDFQWDKDNSDGQQNTADCRLRKQTGTRTTKAK